MKSKTMEQIKRILAQTPKGWKLNVGALLYPFAHGDEYPQFYRTVSKNSEFEIVEYIYYFKCWNNSAYYGTHLVRYRTADEGERFRCGTVYGDKEIEAATRFDIKRLVKLAEKIIADEEHNKKLQLVK